MGESRSSTLRWTSMDSSEDTFSRIKTYKRLFFLFFFFYFKKCFFSMLCTRRDGWEHQNTKLQKYIIVSSHFVARYRFPLALQTRLPFYLLTPLTNSEEASVYSFTPFFTYILFASINLCIYNKGRCNFVARHSFSLLKYTSKIPRAIIIVHGLEIAQLFLRFSFLSLPFLLGLFWYRNCPFFLLQLS